MKDRKGENLKIKLLFFFAVNFIRLNEKNIKRYYNRINRKKCSKNELTTLFDEKC